eukprot:c29503_g1_i1 orf=295-1179(-)
MSAEWVQLVYHSTDVFVSGLAAELLNSTLGVGLTGTPPTMGLPTMDSPTPVVLLVLAYFVVVALGLQWIRVFDLKPRYREPSALQAFIILHNLFCLGLSAYMCIGIVRQAYLNRYMVWGNAYNENETEMAHFIYLFYLSKFVEFVDTIIMLLKFSTRQITVLHVYHHASIAIIWWMIAHHAPGGDAYFSAAVNSGIHVFMYLYYLLSAILRNDETKRHKYLFWGKHLTLIQMLQFVLNMLHSYCLLKMDVPYPRFLSKILFYYMISLLFLFGNFFIHKHAATFEKSYSKQQKGE